jgi:hypothetical protein
MLPLPADLFYSEGTGNFMSCHVGLTDLSIDWARVRGDPHREYMYLFEEKRCNKIKVSRPSCLLFSTQSTLIHFWWISLLYILLIHSIQSKLKHTSYSYLVFTSCLISLLAVYPSHGRDWPSTIALSILFQSSVCLNANIRPSDLGGTIALAPENYARGRDNSCPLNNFF